MKLTFTFEEDDLKEMITAFFKKNGFSVKDLDTVVDKFSQIYPEGLTVEAEAAPPEQSSATMISPRPVVYGPPYKDPPTANTEVTEEEIEEMHKTMEEHGLKPMSISDILNPEKTFPDNKSTGDLEIQHILQQSEKYKDV